MQDFKIDLSLNDIYADGVVTIPTFLLKNYQFVDLKASDMFIYVLLNHQNSSEIEIKEGMFGNDNNLTMKEIIESKHRMMAKGFITVEFKQNEEGKIAEFIKIDKFLERFIELYKANTYKTLANRMKHLIEQNLDIEIESIDAEPDLFKITQLNYSEEELVEILKRCKETNINKVSDIYESLIIN